MLNASVSDSASTAVETRVKLISKVPEREYAPHHPSDAACVESRQHHCLKVLTNPSVISR